MDNLLSKSEIIKQFNISSATLDNWIRTSIPDALVNEKYNPLLIKGYIESTNKLKSRANKKKNTTLEISTDLVEYLSDTSWTQKFIDFLSKSSNFSGQDIINLMTERETSEKTNNPLSAIIPDNDFYAYGVAYQIFLSSGNKSEKGAYYTPKKIVSNIVKRLVSKGKRFLEPCSGVGFFVIEYILEYQRQFKEWPEGLIFANEIDPIAAQICEKTIQLATNNELKSFSVTQVDGLELNLKNIDLIITNPPYGIKNTYKPLKTTEIFSHFVHKCIQDYLNVGGILHFVLPISILSVEKHKEIRKYLLENQTISSIENYGRGFADVFSDIISIEVIKETPNEDSTIKLPQSKKVNQKSLVKASYIITLTDNEDNAHIDKYYKFNHTTLKDCIFALGIVTGNNSFFLSNSPKNNYSKIISGKNIEPGFIDLDKAQFILHDFNKYQQHPPEHLFQEKKIVYKFISKYIISAVDNSKSLTLNSANIIILKDLNLSEEYVSAILNSSIMQKIFQTKYGNPIKVLKKQLQELPIFIFDEFNIKQIEENYKNGRHEVNDALISKLLTYI